MAQTSILGFLGSLLKSPEATYKTSANDANRKAMNEATVRERAAKAMENAESAANPDYGKEVSESSFAQNLISESDAAAGAMAGGTGAAGLGGTGGLGTGTGTGTGTSGGAISPLLEGSMTFEELVAEICNGIDLIFVCKRSTVVVTDYEGIYAEAKYLRDNYHSSVQSEDMSLWQLEEGTYELDVNEYGFYNTVIVEYKNGKVEESYEDLVRVYGKVSKTYKDKTLDKTSAIMKAKAYLAAHVRDFDMSVKANILHDGDIDIGDIVTLENPMTMRNQYRKDKEKRDPEYFFVIGNSINWDGAGPILNSIELRYGAKSPEKKEVPETGASYSGSSSSSTGNVEQAINEVGQMASKISYSGACQTHDCVQQQGTGDCFGMSDFIACELLTRGVQARIRGYPTYVPEHRSVQYMDSSGQWQNFPYRQFGCDTRFNDTSGVNNSHHVDCTCGGNTNG